MADKVDGSVVLAQLQVAFLWECDNHTCDIFLDSNKEIWVFR